MGDVRRDTSFDYKTIMEILSIIANVIGIGGAVFALLAWWQTRRLRAEQTAERTRQNSKIAVELRCGERRILLPGTVRRAEFTRSEILGRIRMLPMKEKGKRFELRYVNSVEFVEQIHEVAQGNHQRVLTINCDEQELAQFAL